MHQGKDACEGVVGGDAIRQFQEGAKEVFVQTCPGSHLHEIIAAGEDAAKAKYKDVLELMLEVLALPTGIGNGLQAMDPSRRLLWHWESSPSWMRTVFARCPKSFILRSLKCVCPVT
jgi:hypothetical protein